MSERGTLRFPKKLNQYPDRKPEQKGGKYGVFKNEKRVLRAEDT